MKFSISTSIVKRIARLNISLDTGKRDYFLSFYIRFRGKPYLQAQTVHLGYGSNDTQYILNLGWVNMMMGYYNALY
jgi:hypothetical protein